MQMHITENNFVISPDVNSPVTAPGPLYRYDWLSGPAACWVAVWVGLISPWTKLPHFADDIFKRIFLNENIRISIKIPLQVISKGPINNIPALAQLMAWRRPGVKPLSDPIMVRLQTHICATRPHDLNLS